MVSLIPSYEHLISRITKHTRLGTSRAAVLNLWVHDPFGGGVEQSFHRGHIRPLENTDNYITKLHKKLGSNNKNNFMVEDHHNMY